MICNLHSLLPLGRDPGSNSSLLVAVLPVKCNSKQSVGGTQYSRHICEERGIVAVSAFGCRAEGEDRQHKERGNIEWGQWVKDDRWMESGKGMGGAELGGRSRWMIDGADSWSCNSSTKVPVLQSAARTVIIGTLKEG